MYLFFTLNKQEAIHVSHFSKSTQGTIQSDTCDTRPWLARILYHLKFI